MKNLLISFPRSGNTWCRYILASYFHPEATLVATPKDRGKGVSKVTNLEHDCVPSWPNTTPVSPCFTKSHAKMSADGIVLTADRPIDYEKVIFLVRNPLDVIVSHINFTKFLHDEDITNLTMYVDSHCVLGSRFESGRWDEFHENWLAYGNIGVIVKYEDLLIDPVSQMRRVFDYCGIPFDEQRMIQAVSNTTIDKLRALESAERQVQVTFFKYGRKDTYKEIFTRDHIRKLVNKLGPTMEKFGYSGNFKDWL